MPAWCPARCRLVRGAEATAHRPEKRIRPRFETQPPARSISILHRGTPHGQPRRNRRVRQAQARRLPIRVTAPRTRRGRRNPITTGIERRSRTRRLDRRMAAHQARATVPVGVLFRLPPRRVQTASRPARKLVAPVRWDIRMATEDTARQTQRRLGHISRPILHHAAATERRMARRDRIGLPIPQLAADIQALPDDRL